VKPRRAPAKAAPQPKLVEPATARPQPQVTPSQRALKTAYVSGKEADFRRAAELQEADLRRNRKPLPIHQSLGYIYLDRLKEPKLAVPHLEAVVHATSGDAGWQQMLAKAYEGAGHLAAASAAYRKAAQRNTKDLWARYHHGRILAKLGRTGEAEAALREAHALDPQNGYVRVELAQLLHGAGRAREARDLALPATDGAAATEAHVLLGDIARMDWDFARARAEYSLAMEQQPEHASALEGLDKIRQAQAPRASLAFYTFKDTDDFEQSGIYANVNTLLTGRIGVSAAANQRSFQQEGQESVERFGSGVNVEYRFSRKLIASAGISHFETEDHNGELGGNAAVYLMPSKAVDLSASFVHAEPVDDSYFTAREGFTRKTLSGQVTVRPTRLITAAVAGSTSRYSDDNTRDWALGSLGYLVSARAAATLKVEYEWLDFQRREPGYSSPSDYTLLRPVVEFAPQLTHWLKLVVRGELPYVRDEREWGHGITAGPRFTVSDSLQAGFSYMNFEIPGGQTNWSGEGWKLDLSCRF
jgi:tetratricopeptide (TPR) repeat protein